METKQNTFLSLNCLQLNFLADIPTQSWSVLAHSIQGPGLGKDISEGSQRPGGGGNWTWVGGDVSEITEPGAGS